MSSYVPFSEESKELWISYIDSLLVLLYSNGNLMLLGQVINQIYEFSVWCVPRATKREFNVKDLYYFNVSAEFTTMCSKLVRVRQIAAHQPFNLSTNRSLIDELLKDSSFKELLCYVFPNTSMFDEMLSTYSRWLYE